MKQGRGFITCIMILILLAACGFGHETSRAEQAAPTAEPVCSPVSDDGAERIGELSRDGEAEAAEARGAVADESGTASEESLPSAASSELKAAELPSIEQLSLEEIFADAELTQEFFSRPDFDIGAYSEAELLTYPALRAYYLEHVDFDISEVEMLPTPESTCFSAVGYSAVWERAVVTFRDSGATYIYYDLTQAVWREFSDAESLGTYYNAHIKGNYRCDRYA